MASVRHLIVNADDFGQSPGVNAGIITAFEKGVVTSASLMVRWPAVAEAAAYARAHSRLSVGLHVDLGEWSLSEETWFPVYEVVDLENPSFVADEVNRQLAAFRHLTGRDPTHLDSHQHVHLRQPARQVFVDTTRRLGVPLRHCDDKVQYCGAFYGQDAHGFPVPEVLSVDGLIVIFAALPPGLTELACHPAAADDLKTMYRKERLRELQVLCDPHLPVALGELGIELRSFHGLGAFS